MVEYLRVCHLLKFDLLPASCQYRPLDSNCSVTSRNDLFSSRGCILILTPALLYFKLKQMRASWRPATLQTRQTRQYRPISSQSGTRQPNEFKFREVVLRFIAIAVIESHHRPGDTLLHYCSSCSAECRSLPLRLLAAV